MNTEQAVVYVRERIEDAFSDFDDDEGVFTTVGNVFVSPWNGAQEFVVTVSDEDEMPLANVHITVRQGAAV